MQTYRFDDHNIRWNKLGDFEHLLYSMLDIDESNKIINVLFKFAANQQIVLHRHKVHNNTFVVQGEHRLYEPDGKLKEIRPVGSYTRSPASNDPHREGGGNQDVVSFSAFVVAIVCYTKCWMMTRTIAILSFQDFVGLFQAQIMISDTSK